MLLCRATLKAVDAAVSSRQWLKAVQILEVLPMKPEVQMYYKKIAQHHAHMGEYEVYRLCFNLFIYCPVLSFVLFACSMTVYDFILNSCIVSLIVYHT